MTPLVWNHHSRRYERGGISWVGLLLLAGIAGAAYLAVTWGPIFVVHYEVRQVVREYMNQAIKSQANDFLIERMCQKLASLDSTTVVDAYGAKEVIPSVKVEPRDVTWERDTSTSPPLLHVAFEYTREVRYPFLEKTSEWVGSVDMTQELTIPNWGPSQ